MKSIDQLNDISFSRVTVFLGINYFN